MLVPPARAGGHRVGRRRQPRPRGDRADPPRRASSSRTACGCSSTPASPTGCCATATGTRASSSRFGGERHRIDFEDLVGASVVALPADRRLHRPRRRARARRRRRALRRHATSRSSTSPTDRRGILLHRRRRHRPARSAATSSSGADGSRSICRHAVPEAARRQYFREYPFAWFGILCRGAAERTRADLQPLRARASP